jgi:alpha-ketoglutarate-dependent taurine dioxygenase
MKNGLVRVCCPAPLKIAEFENIVSTLGKALVTNRHVLNADRTVQELSNDGLFGDGDVDWHHDWSYGRGNYFGTILYNVENAHLSPTWFCDMSKAPTDLKEKYTSVIGKYYPPTHLQDKCFTEKQLKLLTKQRVSRPFVMNHYITGEEILYCSLGTLQEVEVNLGPIREWMEENKYVHVWKENEILLWDNLKMSHKRFSFQGKRLLWRTQFII